MVRALPENGDLSGTAKELTSLMSIPDSMMRRYPWRDSRRPIIRGSVVRAVQRNTGVSLLIVTGARRGRGN
jgi:hypothetical protein